MTDEEGAPRRATADPDRPRPRRRARRALAQQWARPCRPPPTPLPIESGPRTSRRAQVPYGVDLAAAWAWRFLVIAAAGYVVARVLGFFAVITLPLAVALLLAALVAPLVAAAPRRGAAAARARLVVVVGGSRWSRLLTFVGQQVAEGATDLRRQVVDGIEQIQDWLENGPLQASDSPAQDNIQSEAGHLTDSASEGEVVTRLTEVGTALGHVVAGFFIVLFATYFFLADGDRIWAWVVRLSPRAARARRRRIGRVAWPR